MEKNLTPEESLADEVLRDFLRRQQERKYLERRWQLNVNFVAGEQYCDVDAKGELYEESKTFYWQDRRVFNHIAPIVDTRLSKLSRIRPALKVCAASDEDDDRKSAQVSSAILAAACEDCDVDGVMNSAAVWSEICGTAFYKIIWNGEKGNVVGANSDGKKICEGAVDIIAVSPFEIYPYSLSVSDIGEQPSVIHARAVPCREILAAYGVELAGKDAEEFGFAPSVKSNSGGDMLDLKGVERGYELVIERYEKPTAEQPDGRLTVVAGGKLLYDGTLPYINGINGTRGYPFVKQVSMPVAGSFFGASVVDRLVPLQRAYNAVKNRKHEFLNRIAMGTVAVEDGSVDVEEFAEDGLMPGKVIVYRQGSQPPEMLTLGSVPAEFGKEEENLLNEFTRVSGTGEITDNADSFAGVTSATGLQLIIEQDDQRLSLTYGEVKRALKQIGRHILRLYRQFATNVRLMKYAGRGDILTVVSFKGSDVSSDEVVLEADSDINMTTAQKRTVIYEILDKGLLTDADGKTSVSVKNKVLALLGYASLTGERDLEQLNRDRAAEENSAMLKTSAEVKDYDDHAVHITEHTAYLLSENCGKDAEKRICAHIEQHKKKLNKKLSEAENG